MEAHDYWSIACNTSAARLTPAKRKCPKPGKEEAPMSLMAIILMLIGGWLAVAAAMLWGVLRITRRHHPAYRAPQAPAKHEKPARRHASAH